MYMHRNIKGASNTAFSQGWNGGKCEKSWVKNFQMDDITKKTNEKTVLFGGGRGGEKGVGWMGEYIKFSRWTQSLV